MILWNRHAFGWERKLFFSYCASARKASQSPAGRPWVISCFISSSQCPRCMQCDTKFDFIRRKVCFAAWLRRTQSEESVFGSSSVVIHQMIFFFSTPLSHPPPPCVCVPWHGGTLRPLCWHFLFLSEIHFLFWWNRPRSLCWPQHLDGWRRRREALGCCDFQVWDSHQLIHCQKVSNVTLVSLFEVMLKVQSSLKPKRKTAAL